MTLAVVTRMNRHCNTNESPLYTRTSQRSTSRGRQRKYINNRNEGIVLAAAVGNNCGSEDQWNTVINTRTIAFQYGDEAVIKRGLFDYGAR